MTNGLRKRARRFATMMLASFGAFFLLTGVALAQQSERTREVGKKVRCMCGGCNDSASTCYHVGGEFSGPCGQAKTELKAIDDKILKGDSDDAILQSFVQQYGSEVYVEPPKRGLSLVAWLLPSIYLVVGTVVVIFVISRWRSRMHAGLSPAAAGGASHPGISSAELERARQRVARETED
ncbi:MAG: cytochrome c-type biogenesis protein CcmH [Acidobacteria bacterium]|nr:cytochrome c-type biogenesis protein CcmH [Acidobacteriota bacterium]